MKQVKAKESEVILQKVPETFVDNMVFTLTYYFISLNCLRFLNIQLFMEK